ncbi:MAG: tetratricopeptide repeat protein [Gemmatimonadota bacterium]
MTNFQKLKHEARRAEQRSDWARAIDLYRRALDTDEDMTDLSLYNRIGDLYHRQGQTDEAVGSYEQAVERYAENGMHTSAIALCNKILRIAPDRASVFRRLAGLHAQTGLLLEGRANCMEYVRRCLEEDAAGDARAAIEEFTALSGDEEVRLEYADALANAGDPASAIEQLEALYGARKHPGVDAVDLVERIVALGGDAPESSEPAAAEGEAAGTGSEVGPVDLAALVARELGLAAEPSGFDPSPPPPGPEPRRAGEDGLDAVRQLVCEFREQVSHALEGADISIRYDLGIEFMTIGLLEEAIEEFRSVVANPGLVEAASARIAECVALRNAGESFAPRAPLVASAQTVPLAAPAEPDESITQEEPDVSLADVYGVVELPPPDQEPADHTADDEARGGDEADGDNELQGHFFRARLAQYRIRRAEERHSTDHAGHLDLGSAYVEMDLFHEAVREFGVALSGPRPVSARAARSLAELTTGPGTPADMALQALAILAGSDHASSVPELGAALVEAWGPGHELADRLAELLGAHATRTDDLPALESMFPGLLEQTAPPAATHEIEAPAEPSTTGPETAPESVPGSAEGSPPPVAQPPASAEREAEAPRTPRPDHSASASGMKPEDLAELDELLSQLDGADLDGTAMLDLEIEEADQLAADGNHGVAADLLTSVLERLESEHRTREAIDVSHRLLSLRPDDVMLHHHHTELALMVNSREILLASYAELGACLRRNDTARNARAAYGRMLDIDPVNEQAKAAIAEIDADEVSGERRAEEHEHEASAPAGAETAGRGEFDALLDGLDTGGGEENGRVLRYDELDDSGEADPVASSHHDLGLAFRQMGMWDEASRELSAALEGVSDRLSVLEALGECLVKAERGGEAVALLQGELRADEGAEQVGPLYWLGIALQATGDDAAARATFTRIEAASPGYRDAAGRLAGLSL